MELLDAGLALKGHHNFSLWDCLIIAAAQASDCTTLYTEDMSHGRRFGNLVLCNPFL